MALTNSLVLAAASSQYATAADSATLSITGNFAMECWVKFTTLPGSGVDWCLGGKWNNDANQREYRWGLRNSGGTITIGVITSTNGSSFTENYVTWAGAATGTWFHLAVSKNSTTATVYVNGSSIGTATVDSSQFNGTSLFGVGALVNSSPTQFVDGKFALYRVWSTTRTASDFSNNWCVALGSTTNLSAEWVLNNVYTDNSGNGNTLTGVNSPTFGTDVPSVCAAPAVTSIPDARIFFI